MDDSSDVGEAPSRGPLLFQDVMGLAQGLLGGGAQVKFPLSPCFLASLPFSEGRMGETLKKPGQTGLTGWPFEVEVAKVRGTLDTAWGQTRCKEAASR